MSNNDLKPTKRLVLADVMAPTASELDARAAAREQSSSIEDLRIADEGRKLAAEIRLCIGQIELTDNIADGEAATKRLQQLRSLALEYLARVGK